jgi:hypothetical protein
MPTLPLRQPACSHNTKILTTALLTLEPASAGSSVMAIKKNQMYLWRSNTP